MGNFRNRYGWQYVFHKEVMNTVFMIPRELDNFIWVWYSSACGSSGGLDFRHRRRPETRFSMCGYESKTSLSSGYLRVSWSRPVSSRCKTQ